MEFLLHFLQSLFYLELWYILVCYAIHNDFTVAVGIVQPNSNTLINIIVQLEPTVVEPTVSNHAQDTINIVTLIVIFIHSS